MRTRVAVLGVLTGLALLAGCTTPAGRYATIQFDNSYFYDEAGKFQVERAKDAYIALMRYHGYPVYKEMREKLWASDYGAGQFTKLGLAARMWVNNEKDQYMLMDIYLLPGQMLPEHWHEKPDRLPQKMEGWLVRYGLSHIVGEGEANLGPTVVVPKCHMNGTTLTKHEVVARPGDFVPLGKAGSRHWQLAGPYGAIITEVANVHADSAVRHSDLKMNDNFLGK
ncbi:MAG TPA: hypothetical protein VNE39_02270 [Planctomycetota bacterium]|nr:hypothetical protein [Planctomycetota bacterium]